MTKILQKVRFQIHLVKTSPTNPADHESRICHWPDAAEDPADSTPPHIAQNYEDYKKSADWGSGAFISMMEHALLYSRKHKGYEIILVEVNPDTYLPKRGY